MRIVASHESKHEAAMSKAGDAVVVVPTSTGYRYRFVQVLMYIRISRNHIIRNLPVAITSPN